MTKRYTLKKKIIVASSVVAAVLLSFFLIIPYTVSAVVYSVIFTRRFSTTEYLRYDLTDFEGLQADKHEFQSENNQTLVGYRYSLESSRPKGVVVVVHGLGGGGQNGYMDVTYYFVKNGYDVFAYDATGNDESTGKGINGLPHGIIDLHHALEYIKEIDEFKDLPVMLWGHSWGGYCVSAILNWHSEVKAIASISGFNRSSDLVESYGAHYVGGLAKISMPYVNSLEKIKFGKYASATALDGFENSEAGIFIAHSSDDDVVPIKFGLDKYYKKYSDNPRFKFVRYENKGHTDILYSNERISYLEDFYDDAIEFLGANATDKELTNYVKDNLNREIYCNGLENELFTQIVDFYDSYLN